MTPATLIQSSKRIVIKIGSALMADEKLGTARQDWLNTLAQDVAALVDPLRGFNCFFWCDCFGTQSIGY
ncbi:MAG: hypothetical protein R3D88_00220 [Alphaproteobacteria bacterium]